MRWNTEGSQISASLQQSCSTTQLTMADWEVSTSGPHVFFCFFFLFSRAKSLGRRLSNGRQIATRCVADTRTSVRRNPTLFMTATVTAKPSQAAVLGESDCTRGTLNVACFWYHSRAALLINTFPYHKLYYAITVLRRGSSISTHGIQLTAGVFFETWVTKMRTWLLPWERL